MFTLALFLTFTFSWGAACAEDKQAPPGSSLLVDFYQEAVLSTLSERLEQGQDVSLDVMETLFPNARMKTSQRSSYLKVPRSGGRSAFLVLDKEERLSQLILSEDIPSKDELAFIVPGKTTEREIRAFFKSNETLFPINFKPYSGYVVKEGVVVVSFSTDSTPYIVDTVDFIKDEDPDLEKSLFSLIPYILPEDKAPDEVTSLHGCNSRTRPRHNCGNEAG